MVHVRRIARLGTLAVGLGLGAAWAHTPVASADSSTDWLSAIDGVLAGGALPAPSSGLDLAISFDGYSLVSDGTADAYTNPGEYDLAIAYGANSHAEAVDGTGDTAIASGSGAVANAYDGTGDYALAEGTHAYAEAGGASGSNYDSAIDIGNNDPISTGNPDGAYAGAGALTGHFGTGIGSYDTAIDIGNNTNGASLGGNDGAYAGAGGLTGSTGDGNHDTAIDVGNNSGDDNGATAVNGDGNYASESGDTTGQSEGVYAGAGNDNTAVSDVTYTINNGGVGADNGNDNYASVLGPDNTSAYASYGDSNIAYINDPFSGAMGLPDYAGAGNGASNDLAEVLLTNGKAFAESTNLLYDIVSLFGNTAGSF